MLTHADWDFIAQENQRLSALAEAGSFGALELALAACDWQLSEMCDFNYYTEHCRDLWGPRPEDLAQVVAWVPMETAVLDVGFGYGHLLRALSTRHFEAAQAREEPTPQGILHGADSCQMAIDLLQKEIPEATLRLADVQNLPYPSEKFPIVVCMEVLEHLSPVHGQRGLKEIARVCQPNGRLLLSTRINENLSHSLLACPHCGLVQHPAGHVRSFSETLLRAELEIAGWWPSEILRSPGGIVARCAKRC